MTGQDSIFLKGLALFSGLTSFMFVYYALGVLNADNAPQWTRVFAYVAAGYGLGNVYILSWAWRTADTGPVWANKLFALCFLGVFLMDMGKTGVESGLEYLGALGVAFVLWLNWYAVKKVTARDKAPAAKKGRR